MPDRIEGTDPLFPRRRQRAELPDVSEAAVEAGAAAIYEEPFTFCDSCNGIGSDENACFWCSPCEGKGYVIDEDNIGAAKEVAEIDARTAIAAALPVLIEQGWTPPGRRAEMHEWIAGIPARIEEQDFLDQRTKDFATGVVEGILGRWFDDGPLAGWTPPGEDARHGD